MKEQWVTMPALSLPPPDNGYLDYVEFLVINSAAVNLPVHISQDACVGMEFLGIECAYLWLRKMLPNCSLKSPLLEGVASCKCRLPVLPPPAQDGWAFSLHILLYFQCQIFVLFSCKLNDECEGKCVIFYHIFLYGFQRWVLDFCGCCSFFFLLFFLPSFPPPSRSPFPFLPLSFSLPPLPSSPLPFPPLSSPFLSSLPSY